MHHIGRPGAGELRQDDARSRSRFQPGGSVVIAEELVPNVGRIADNRVNQRKGFFPWFCREEVPEVKNRVFNTCFAKCRPRGVEGIFVQVDATDLLGESFRLSTKSPEAIGGTLEERRITTTWIQDCLVRAL